MKSSSVEKLFGDTDSFQALREGMYQVAQGSNGTARKYFAEFPVNVGAKTGTAEKDGKIPPKDEESYLKENIEIIDPSLTVEQVVSQAEIILLDRNEELAEYEKQKDNVENQTIRDQLNRKIDSLIASGYLTMGSAMREAMKQISKLELTDTIINQYRDTYNSYAWFVGFAPYEDPEIAVVVFIPQGGHGGYAAPIARDVIASYMGISPEGTELSYENQQ